MDGTKHPSGSSGQTLDEGKPEPGSRFEDGAVLAWLVDQEGYRSASDWSLTPIRDLPGAGRGGRRLVDVRDALGRDAGLPELRIEPTSEGEVRVTSRLALVVQLLGEPAATATGQAVVVPYGSVVRAGPVLLAPLYREQVDSLRAGRLTLARPGGGPVVEGGRLSALDAAATPRNPRRPLLYVWMGLWLLAFPAAIAFTLWYWAESRSPHHGGYATFEMDTRSAVYFAGALWFLIIVVGSGIHRLVTRFVQAGQPEPGAARPPETE